MDTEPIDSCTVAFGIKWIPVGSYKDVVVGKREVDGGLWSQGDFAHQKRPLLVFSNSNPDFQWRRVKTDRGT